MTSDDDYLLKQWLRYNPSNQNLDGVVKKMMIDAIEISMDRLESYEVDLRTSKIVMEELCDWHACNVIDEAIRTTGKAVKLIAGKMEELKNDGQY